MVGIELLGLLIVAILAGACALALALAGRLLGHLPFAIAMATLRNALLVDDAAVLALAEPGALANAGGFLRHLPAAPLVAAVAGALFLGRAAALALAVPGSLLHAGTLLRRMPLGPLVLAVVRIAVFIKHHGHGRHGQRQNQRKYKGSRLKLFHVYILLNKFLALIHHNTPTMTVISQTRMGAEKNMIVHHPPRDL